MFICCGRDVAIARTIRVYENNEYSSLAGRASLSQHPLRVTGSLARETVMPCHGSLIIMTKSVLDSYPSLQFLFSILVIRRVHTANASSMNPSALLSYVPAFGYLSWGCL